MDKALIELMLDLLEQKKREARYLLIALIAVIALEFATVGAFLWYESGMETSVTTTTTQKVQGDDGNIVNGDQYNDEAENRSQ